MVLCDRALIRNCLKRKSVNESKSSRPPGRRATEPPRLPGRRGCRAAGPPGRRATETAGPPQLVQVPCVLVLVLSGSLQVPGGLLRWHPSTWRPPSTICTCKVLLMMIIRRPPEEAAHDDDDDLEATHDDDDLEADGGGSRAARLPPHGLYQVLTFVNGLPTNRFNPLSFM